MNSLQSVVSEAMNVVISVRDVGGTGATAPRILNLSSR
jgi:hypothetical protein